VGLLTSGLGATPCPAYVLGCCEVQEPPGTPAAGWVAIVGLALRYPGVGDPRRQHPTLPRSHPQHPRPCTVHTRSEATDTHLRALTKRAYGFHSPTH